MEEMRPMGYKTTRQKKEVEREETHPKSPPSAIARFLCQSHSSHNPKHYMETDPKSKNHVNVSELQSTRISTVSKHIADRRI